MAEKDVAQFFESVYNDRSLQGALHEALIQVAPDVVVEIAKKKGYEVSKKDLKSLVPKGAELSEDELDKVAGGALSSSYSTKISTASLGYNFWGSFSGRLGGGGLASSGFGLTIPGPSFVLVNSAEKRSADEAPAGEKVSAQELFDRLGD